MASVALGVKVLSRTEKLAQLLESADGTDIEQAYVADGGESNEKKAELYDREFSFNLTVLDLPYDSGLAYGRNQIVDAMTEDYLLLVDSDMTIPPNYHVLQAQLEARDDLGGVCGMLLEDGRIRVKCQDLCEDSNRCVWDVQEPKAIHTVAAAPLVEFDLIENAALFRRECLQEQSWDEQFKIHWEHEDFYVAHSRNTDWSFGLCPQVYFRHHPGGDSNYESMRAGEDRLQAARQDLLDKWGYDSVEKNSLNWVDTYRHGYPRPSLFRQAYNVYSKEGILTLSRRGIAFLRRALS